MSIEARSVASSSKQAIIRDRTYGKSLSCCYFSVFSSSNEVHDIHDDDESSGVEPTSSEGDDSSEEEDEEEAPISNEDVAAQMAIENDFESDPCSSYIA